MVWLVLLLLGATVLGAMFVLGRVRGAALQLAGAALLIGAGGYALSGRPELGGGTAAARAKPPAPPFVQPAERDRIFGQFTSATRWFRIAEGYFRRGKTGEGVATIQAGLRAHPSDSLLWIGYGDALVRHGRGMSPPALLAFERAVALAPDHPGPRYFLGLARLASKDEAGALKAWREALARTTSATVWRSELDRKLRLLETLRNAA